MLNIDNKFNIGDEVYILSQQPIEHICPVCEGKGSFMHNGAKILCPKCENGKLFDRTNRIYQVMDKLKITGSGLIHMTVLILVSDTMLTVIRDQKTEYLPLRKKRKHVVRN